MCTLNKLDSFNKEMANKLGVDILNLKLEISKESKSKYGHCKYIKNNEFIINLSEFVAGSILEDYTLKHEICHAYDFYYYKSLPNWHDTYPHGLAWKKLMELVFNFKNARAQGFDLLNIIDIETLQKEAVKAGKREESKLKFIKEDNTFYLYSNNLKLGTFYYVDKREMYFNAEGGKNNNEIIEMLFLNNICYKVS